MEQPHEKKLETESLGFTQIPYELGRKILEETHTKGQSKVLARLLMLSLGHQETTCLTDTRTLAKEAHVGKNTVTRALQALEKRGMISYVFKSRTGITFK